MTDACERAPISARFPDLEGKVAVVTGATRGIGRATARFLADQGMKVVLTGRSAEDGEAVLNELRERGHTCRWVTADLATADGADRVFETALEAFAGVDLLVNNAASRSSRDFLRLDPEVYRRFEENVRMVYELSLRVARHMAEGDRGGVIVHVSSVGGLRGHRGMAGYDASKGAVDALTRSMAMDLAPHGIRVNAVAPGLTLSEELKERIGSRLPGKVRHIPLGREADCEEVAAAVAFLASDAGRYITGQVLYVDGGLSVQLTPPGIHV